MTPSYEIVNYGSIEQGYEQVCYQCLNKEMAEAIGLEGFEHVKFEPVGLTDCVGKSTNSTFAPTCSGQVSRLMLLRFATDIRPATNSRSSVIAKMMYWCCLGV